MDCMFAASILVYDNDFKRVLLHIHDFDYSTHARSRGHFEFNRWQTTSMDGNNFFFFPCQLLGAFLLDFPYSPNA